MRETNITVAGNVGATPTYFAAKDGKPAKLVLSVASTRRARDVDTGEWRDANTSWYDVWLNGRLADNARESISKGDAVLVTGSVEIRRWEDGDRSGHKAVISARAFGPDLFKYPVQISRVRIADQSEPPPEQSAEGQDGVEGYDRVDEDGASVDDAASDDPGATSIADRLASTA